MEKMISYNTEARQGLKSGIDKLANAVKVTLGAKGRNVLIEDLYGGYPHITKDGVTVAKSIELDDKLERVAVKLMKQVASNTNDTVGDGTTTSIVLAQAIVELGMKAIDEKCKNPILVKKGIDMAVEDICKYLRKIAVPVDGDTSFINKIATISANNDKEIGDIITKAFEEVGKHGVVRLAEQMFDNTTLEMTKGYSFDRGLYSPYFATDLVNNTARLENPFILLTDHIIKDLSDFGFDGKDIPLFSKIWESKRPLLIICDDIEGMPYQKLVENKMKGSFNSTVVKSPEFGDRRSDIMEDLAVLTGGKYISREKGMKLSDITLEDLGTCDLVEMDMNNTSIIGGSGDSTIIENRVSVIKEVLSKETGDFAISKLEERLAKLTGGVATINLGAGSEVEFKEKKDRVVDALSATTAAIKSGVVAGGGVALFRCPIGVKSNNEDIQEGIDLMNKVKSTPIASILHNAGEDFNEIIYNILQKKSKNFGYDVKGEKFGDMFKLGILDPVEVTITALKNASSVAGTLLTTECVVSNKDVDKDKPEFSI